MCLAKVKGNKNYFQIVSLQVINIFLIQILGLQVPYAYTPNEYD